MLEPFAPTWARLHDRATTPAEGVRFYSQSHNASYTQTRESVRDALLDQARRPIDFSKTIEQAYADGIRVFVEAGPRNVLSRSIARDARPAPAPCASPSTILAATRSSISPASPPSSSPPASPSTSTPSPGISARPPPPVTAVPVDRLALTMPARMPPFDPNTLGAAERRVSAAPKERTIPVTRMTDPAPFPEAPETLHVVLPAAAEGG